MSPWTRTQPGRFTVLLHDETLQSRQEPVPSNALVRHIESLFADLQTLYVPFQSRAVEPGLLSKQGLNQRDSLFKDVIARLRLPDGRVTKTSEAKPKMLLL